MITILAALFVFGVLVTVHEFGHFITAKMTGMRVDEFAIGFGPNIIQKKLRRNAVQFKNHSVRRL